MVVTPETDAEEWIAKVYAFDELMTDEQLRDRLENALSNAMVARTWEKSA